MKQESTAMVVLWAVLGTCQDIKCYSKLPNMFTNKAVSIWILLSHIKNFKDHPEISSERKFISWNIFASASKDTCFPDGIFLCWRLPSMNCSSILLHLSHYTFSISIFIWIPSLFVLSFTVSYQLATVDFVKPLCCFLLSNINSRMTFLQARGRGKKSGAGLVYPSQLCL